MSPNLHIALHFLTSRKRSMLMSLAGIIFGVSFFIVTQAQTSGFESFFIKAILGSNGALRIQDKIQPLSNTLFYTEGIAFPDSVKGALRAYQNVADASEVLCGKVNISTAARDYGVKAYGIDLDTYRNVSDLGSQIVEGQLDTFRMNPLGILLGIDLAKRLHLEVGAMGTVRYRNQIRSYRICALFQTGIREIDRDRIYLHLPEARSLLETPSGASFIQVSLFDINRAQADARNMTETLQHQVESWQEREQSWLEVFRALRISSAITVSTLIVIAGLGMFNTLAMTVIDKTKEIAILRSMGYTRGDVTRIFLYQGGIILGFGLLLGGSLGASVTYLISHFPIRIRGIFSTDTFVVKWDLDHYIWATVVATVIVMAASYLPSRRAAQIDPGKIIRETSG